MISILQGMKEGDTVTVKVYRAKGASEAVGENSLNLEAIDPDGEYIDIQVVLRIIGSQSSFVPAASIAG